MDTLVIKTAQGWKEIILPNEAAMLVHSTHIELTHNDVPILSVLGKNRFYTNQGKILEVNHEGKALSVGSNKWTPTEEMEIAGIKFFTIPRTIKYDF